MEMPKRKGGLGRGLEALIPTNPPAPHAGGSPAQVPLDLVRPSLEQPRKHFDDAELRALADSVRQHGILQPLLVVQEADGYRLIAGERRLRAARLAGLAYVPVVVREQPSRDQSLALSLIENIQRHDLNPLEEAEAYRQLLEDFELTHEDVARRVGKTRAHITNSIRLLSLAPALQGALMSGAITAGHARALAGLEHEAQENALRRVLREEMNVRETEALVRSGGGDPLTVSKKGPGRTRPQNDPEWRALENQFRDALKTKVQLTKRRKGGRLVISFYSDEELEGIFKRIVGS